MGQDRLLRQTVQEWHEWKPRIHEWVNVQRWALLHSMGIRAFVVTFVDGIRSFVDDIRGWFLLPQFRLNHLREGIFPLGRFLRRAAFAAHDGDFFAAEWLQA